MKVRKRILAWVLAGSMALSGALSQVGTMQAHAKEEMRHHPNGDFAPYDE